MNKWGYLRETEEIAKKAHKRDKGIYTGLDTYLKVIFPNTHDWIHDKAISGVRGCKRLIRPDYRSESLNLIIEVDGLPHYTDPYKTKRDIENTKIYEGLGYKVVRIPFFLQLTNANIKILFDVDVKQPMFDPKIHSLDIASACTPAFLCGAGIKRIREEYKRFPEQFKTDLEYLKKQPKKDQILIDWEDLL